MTAAQQIADGSCWALLPEVLRGLAIGAPAGASSLGRFVADSMARRVRGSSGSFAIIPVQGVLSYRSNLLGTPVMELTSAIREAAADPGVEAIILDIDSPGGAIQGIPELANEIASSRKRIVALANPSAVSAAYWLASAAREIVVAPSGEVGGIGVVAAHIDESIALQKEGVKISLISAGTRKTDGNPYEPLSSRARADIQSRLDAYYGMFARDVARGRGVAESSVRAGFGNGRTVLASEAVRLGMADRVETLDGVLMGRANGGGRRRRAGSRGPRSIELLRRDLEIRHGGDPDRGAPVEPEGCSRSGWEGGPARFSGDRRSVDLLRRELEIGMYAGAPRGRSEPILEGTER